MQIPVIDIFAGPGGLGEGFSAADGDIKFSIKLSIEKDPVAHRTLKLRSFLRSFGYGHFPSEYYRFVSDPEYSVEQLYDAYPDHAHIAEEEAWQAELGVIDTETLHKRIRKALGKCRHWILLGGPPCQAYSLVGRARMTGLGLAKNNLKGKDLERFLKQKMDCFHGDQRHTLYKEYLKIVAVHKPTIFVMENVKGILSSQHEEQPIFKRILEDLRDPWRAIDSDAQLAEDKALHNHKPSRVPKYRLYSFVKSNNVGRVPELNLKDYREPEPKDFIIRAEEHGIPQKRHRVVILGILEEFIVQPRQLEPKSKPITVKTTLKNLPRLRSGLSKEKDSHENWQKLISKAFTVGKLKEFDKNVRDTIEDAMFKLSKSKNRGSTFISINSKEEDSELHKWFYDPHLKGVLHHETRSHMTPDLWRYMFSSAYTQVHGQSPKVDEFPKWLLPEHENVTKPLKSRKKSEPVHFRDRFRVQNADEAATTITSHISKDGHYYIHYDPSQCRSLTVREAARLQTFPDNYFFEGNRTQQYHQVGNAVPPLLARKLAHVVADVVEQCIEADKSAAIGKSRKIKVRA